MHIRLNHILLFPIISVHQLLVSITVNFFFRSLFIFIELSNTIGTCREISTTEFECTCALGWDGHYCEIYSFESSSIQTSDSTPSKDS